MMSLPVEAPSGSEISSHFALITHKVKMFQYLIQELQQFEKKCSMFLRHPVVYMYDCMNVEYLHKIMYQDIV